MIFFSEQPGTGFMPQVTQSSGWATGPGPQTLQPVNSFARASLFSFCIAATACGVGIAGTANSQTGAPTRSGPQSQSMQAIRTRNADEDISDIREILSTIRLAFGLKVAELANILQVERQTIYGWMDESKQHKLHAKNTDRVRAIYELARSWLHQTREPARKWLIAPAGAAGGSSILEEMSKKKIDSGRLFATLTSISKNLSDSRHEENFLDSWRARGLATPPVEGVSFAIPLRSESSD